MFFDTKKAIKMPLFGKKDSEKRSRRETRETERQHLIEEKYALKDLLGT